MTLLFIGTTELLLIAGVALLIFGGKKIPELMNGLGKGMKSYKEGLNGTSDVEEPEKKVDEEAKPEESGGNGQ